MATSAIELSEKSIPYCNKTSSGRGQNFNFVGILVFQTGRIILGRYVTVSQGVMVFLSGFNTIALVDLGTCSHSYSPYYRTIKVRKY